MCPLVSGLSAEFPNAKKAAAVDYYTYFLTTSSTLAAGLNDIQDTVRQCNSGYGDRGFFTEMRAFQSGSSNNENASPFQLFSLVNEFMDMVDQACKHLSENLQRRKTNETHTRSALV